jgi:hypothetical protein
MPAIGRSTEGLRARVEVAGFSAFLRHAHAEAVTAQEERLVTVDPAAGVVLDAAGTQVRARRALPERMSVEPDPPTAFTVRFFPQGSSTGGTFRLTSSHGIAYRVSVDPLTSRVTSRRDAPR